MLGDDIALNIDFGANSVLADGGVVVGVWNNGRTDASAVERGNRQANAVDRN